MPGMVEKKSVARLSREHSDFMLWPPCFEVTPTRFQMQLGVFCMVRGRGFALICFGCFLGSVWNQYLFVLSVKKTNL